MVHPKRSEPVVPVILAGGAGTRLWPLSRLSFPKQFTTLSGGKSLFQATLERFSGPGFARPVILTRDAYRFVVTEQMGAIGKLPEAIVLEPEPRNTGPAILAAALVIAARTPDAVMLVSPSDHHFGESLDFSGLLPAALGAARAGRLVTFGIAPTGPETGYGYLELSGAPGDGAVPLSGFVEKPDRDRAVEMLAQERFLWNAGIFLFRVQEIIEAFRSHAPEMIAPVEASVAGSHRDLGFTRLAAEPWARLAGQSIDYAIMEKATNLSVVPLRCDWSDMGNWEAVRRAAQDRGDTSDHVVTLGQAIAEDCSDSLLFSSDGDTALYGLGLQGIIAVATGDAVLVADRSRAQDVGRAVKSLRARGVAQADAAPVDRRPWGWFEVLARGPAFQVKKIVVHPGGILSLQSHVHRAEHWVVVAGAARVTIGTAQHDLKENQSIYVPQSEVHRLENATDADLVMIEVQTGTYLGEDDVTRYEDAYRRE